MFSKTLEKSLSPSANIVANSSFLLQLARATRADKRRLSLIQKATPEQLLSIVEICLNILKSRLPLTKPQRRVLATQALCIRRLSRTRNAKGAKSLLTQKGSGVPAFISLLANLALPILSHVMTPNST